VLRPRSEATKDLFLEEQHALKAAGKPPSATMEETEEPNLKKYLVVKMAEGWSQVVNWIVMPGLYTLEAAQQFVDKAMMDEPGAQFLIQEVGAA
jgi:hypothetical protein